MWLVVLVALLLCLILFGYLVGRGIIRMKFSVAKPYRREEL